MNRICQFNHFCVLTYNLFHPIFDPSVEDIMDCPSVEAIMDCPSVEAIMDYPSVEAIMDCPSVEAIMDCPRKMQFLCLPVLLKT